MHIVHKQGRIQDFSQGGGSRGVYRISVREGAAGAYTGFQLGRGQQGRIQDFSQGGGRFSARIAKKNFPP